jgi:hypothetical protein
MTSLLSSRRYISDEQWNGPGKPVIGAQQTIKAEVVR